MAIRLFVEPTLAIRAVATTNSLRIVAPQFRAATALVSRPAYAAVVSYPLYQADLSYQQLISLAAYLKLQASDVILDPDTKNRYFRDLDSISFAETSVLDFSKSLDTDAVIASDAYSASVEKPLESSFEFAEYLEFLLTFIREYADEFGFVDVVQFDSEKSLADLFGFSDSIDSKAVAKSLIQETLVSDLPPAKDFSTPRADQFGFSDQLTRLVAYSRGFSETAPELLDNSVLLFAKGLDQDSISWTDSSFTDVSKGLAQPLVLADLFAASFNRPVSDGFAVEDFFDKAVDFQRGFDETITALSDTRPVFEFNLGPAEQITILEALSYDYTTTAADQAAVADASSIDYSRPEADGISTSDTFNRVVVFSRVFSDVFTLDDNATVGGVIKDTYATKNNVVGFSDTQSYTFAKALSDSFTVTEVLSRVVAKAATDSVTVSESLTLSKRSTASSVLNAGAFNFAPINN